MTLARDYSKSQGVSLNPHSVRFDWQQYFYNFCALHGGNPVEYVGKMYDFPTRLLFQDGWSYSAVDYKGPEFPPPEDAKELNKWKRIYWALRLKIIRQEVLLVKAQLTDLINLQAGRSAPLQRMRRYKDSTGAWVRRTEALDLSKFEQRLDWLEQDRDYCLLQLLQLRNRDGQSGIGDKEEVTHGT